MWRRAGRLRRAGMMENGHRASGQAGLLHTDEAEGEETNNNSRGKTPLFNIPLVNSGLWLPSKKNSQRAFYEHIMDFSSRMRLKMMRIMKMLMKMNRNKHIQLNELNMYLLSLCEALYVAAVCLGLTSEDLPYYFSGLNITFGLFDHKVVHKGRMMLNIDEDDWQK